MIDHEKVLKGLEHCSRTASGKKVECSKCPYNSGDFQCVRHLFTDALVLLKSLEATHPAVSASPGTTYQRLMAIKVELEDKNKALSTEARELRRLNESLSNLCHNLLKRLAKYE